MPLDVIIEAAGRAILEVVLVGIFYWPGWLILRAVTLGRYPPVRGTPHNQMFVAVVALATLLGSLAIYYSLRTV
jgi:hypothetical protein